MVLQHSELSELHFNNCCFTVYQGNFGVLFRTGHLCLQVSMNQSPLEPFLGTCSCASQYFKSVQCIHIVHQAMPNIFLPSSSITSTSHSYIFPQVSVHKMGETAFWWGIYCIPVYHHLYVPFWACQNLSRKRFRNNTMRMCYDRS